MSRRTTQPPQCVSFTPEQRWAAFWAKVDKAGAVPALKPDLGPCWVWRAGTVRGYGSFKNEGKTTKAHIFLHGPAPEAAEWDHLCRNHACVGPTEGPPHLEAVTHQVNTRRGVGPTAINASKTHCVNGHPFDKDNTALRSEGGRYCRACNTLRGRRHDAP